MAFNFEISQGAIFRPQKVVIYGPEGIGKSTFAAKFPEPLVIDTEGSTNHLDVRRLPRPTSWEMLRQMIDEVANNPDICKTLVIDTVDWAERLCAESICSKAQKTSIEDFGYGKGYVIVKEEFARLLDRLSDLTDRGITVVLIAHSMIRKFERPDESGAYDRWELKLGGKGGSQLSALVKEWSDLLLFVNYKEIVTESGDSHKKKAAGGKRMMYTCHHPAWDAKNRHDLAPELPFEYEQIEHIIEAHVTFPPAEKQAEPKKPAAKKSTAKKSATKAPAETPAPAQEQPAQADDLDGICKPLADLMRANNVTRAELMAAVERRGYFPSGTKIEDYPQDFVDGCLIAAWAQVYGIIANEIRPGNIVPF